jgi:hypothetical protein
MRVYTPRDPISEGKCRPFWWDNLPKKHWNTVGRLVSHFAAKLLIPLN